MENNVFLSRACPICSSLPPLNLTVQSKINAELLDFDKLIPYWNGFFKDKVFFSYYRCSGCSLLYAPTFFNGRQLEQLYGQMPPNMDEVPMDALRRTQNGYFQALKKNSKLQGGFVEVGPDIGLFTENCIREGKYSEYWLFEPNQAVLPLLIKIVKGHKNNIIHEMFGFEHVPDKVVSTAVMIHVLDHLLDPVATLKELRQKMEPDARLLLVTHNESSLLRHFFNWRWPAFCLQHPQIYSPQSMKKLLDAAGFKIIKQEKTINYFEIRFLFKHLLWALGINTKSVPSFCGITLGLKLGNILTIATQKNEIKNG